MSDSALARNCCMARMLPGEVELVSELTGLSGKAKSVFKRFERSNGLDIALYKNYVFTFSIHIEIHQNEKMTVFRTRSLSGKITKTCWWKDKSKKRGIEENRNKLDRRGAGMDGERPGRVQQIGRKQTFMAKINSRCPSRGRDQQSKRGLPLEVKFNYILLSI